MNEQLATKVIEQTRDTVRLPEFSLPPELQERYESSIAALAQKTTEWSAAERRFELKADAPDLFISPLRSGPIAKVGYDAYCAEHTIPQPPTLEVVGIGSETRNNFLQKLQLEDPDFDLDDWDTEEVQAQFRGWIASGEDPAVAQAIAQIRQQVAQLPISSEKAVKFVFVDDAGGEYGDVRNKVTPAILTAALGDRPYTYEYHLMFPKKYFDEGLWYDQVVQATFGKNLPFVQREFLCEAVRGAFDDLYQRPDILTEFGAEFADDVGNHELSSVERMKILSEIFRRNNQEFNDMAYPGQIAESAFEALYEKYGEELLQLQEKLVEALREIGRQVPAPHKV